MKEKYIETGKIVGTHGIRGEVRVQPWCDSPEFLTPFKTLYLDKNGTAIKVKCRPNKNVVLMKIKDVDTIEQAEMLRGKVVYIDRDDAALEDGTYFQCDLFGCEVFDADTNEKLGVICDVSQTGANDVWHIKRETREYLIPSIPDVVINVDIDGGRVVIRPLKGIFDDEN